MYADRGTDGRTDDRTIAALPNAPLPTVGRGIQTLELWNNCAVGPIVISISVCLSVCPLAYRSSRTARLNFTDFVYGRGLVLLWRRCNMLCTSGFVDDVMFSYHVMGQYHARRNAEKFAVQVERQTRILLGI